MKPGRPVLLRGAAKRHLSGFERWSDRYLADTFGELEIEFENGRKEDRNAGAQTSSLGDFLLRYSSEDIYGVWDLPAPMLRDIELLPIIRCGGATSSLSKVVMWFSGGGTKSVLHNDDSENINCLFDGTKDLLFYDAADRVTLESPLSGFEHRIPPLPLYPRAPASPALTSDAPQFIC